MRVVVQRVKAGRVVVNGGEVSAIGRGLVLLVGIGRDDTLEDIERLAKKVLGLRIFEDGAGKMNLNVGQAGGEILSVPQFTLYAETRKGNRPGFEFSADPEMADGYWKRFNSALKGAGATVREGVFAAHMEVHIVNDGPVTIWLDSKNLKTGGGS
jgi:D-tyrosyl-tRNA(Tyr) deacylase